MSVLVLGLGQGQDEGFFRMRVSVSVRVFVYQKSRDMLLVQQSRKLVDFRVHYGLPNQR